MHINYSSENHSKIVYYIIGNSFYIVKLSNSFHVYFLLWDMLSREFFAVPSENKKDQRSIEQTLADIRAKRRKLETNNQTNSSSNNSTK